MIAFLAKSIGVNDAQMRICSTQDDAWGSVSTVRGFSVAAGYHPHYNSAVFITENIDPLHMGLCVNLVEDICRFDQFYNAQIKWMNMDVNINYAQN